MTQPRARKSTAIIDFRLRSYLAKAAPDAGDRLPPERELISHLGCSRTTLRKVLATLEQEGEVWRHVGQGTFRGRRPSHLPIRDTIVIDGASPSDVMRARELLEPRVAAEAARQATPNDVQLLREKVRAARHARDRLDCEAADDSFHKAVAQVARNPLLLQMLVFLSGARRRIAWQRQWDRTYRRIGVDKFRGLHSDQHASIVEAISQNDTDGAEKAMSVHLRTIQAAMTRTTSSQRSGNLL